MKEFIKSIKLKVNKALRSRQTLCPGLFRRLEMGRSPFSIFVPLNYSIGSFSTLTVLACLLVGMLSSCTYTKSDPGDVPEPDPGPVPEVYEVEIFEFTDINQAHIDTVKGKIFEYECSNRTADTIPFPEELDKYSYSYFHMPDQKLPEGSNIDSLEVFTIDIWDPLLGGCNLQPFAFGKKLEKTERGLRSFVVYVPPGYQYKGSANYIGYATTLSYRAVLKNIYSGELLELTGKWEGLQESSVEGIGGLEKLED